MIFCFFNCVNVLIYFPRMTSVLNISFSISGFSVQISGDCYWAEDTVADMYILTQYSHQITRATYCRCFRAAWGKQKHLKERHVKFRRTSSLAVEGTPLGSRVQFPNHREVPPGSLSPTPTPYTHTTNR